MSTTTVDLAARLNAKEVFTATESPTGSSELERTAQVNSLSFSGTLGSTTTPKVDKPPVYYRQSAAGTVTLNLQSAPALTVPGTGVTRNVDMSGAKVKGLLIKCGANNAGSVTIAPGAANPYPLFGTGRTIEAGPGAELLLGFNQKETNLAAVSGTVRNIDITTTGTDVVEIVLVLGT